MFSFTRSSSTGYSIEALSAQIERHEDDRPSIYFDSEGILTMGKGHALGHVAVPEEARAALKRSGVMDRPFSKQVRELIFAEDVAEADKQLRALAQLRGVNFTALSPARQQVLVNMAFNMGAAGDHSRLGKFVKMWEALGREDYAGASNEMMDSKWARQVGDYPPSADHPHGGRAWELTAMMREG